MKTKKNKIFTVDLNLTIINNVIYRDTNMLYHIL